MAWVLWHSSHVFPYPVHTCLTTMYLSISPSVILISALVVCPGFLPSAIWFLCFLLITQSIPFSKCVVVFLFVFFHCPFIKNPRSLPVELWATQLTLANSQEIFRFVCLNAVRKRPPDILAPEYATYSEECGWHLFTYSPVQMPEFPTTCLPHRPAKFLLMYNLFCCHLIPCGLLQPKTSAEGPIS